MNLNDPDRARAEFERALESEQPDTIARAAMFHIWPLLSSHTELLVTSVSALDSKLLARYPVLRLVHPMTALLARTTQPYKPLLHADEARSMSPEEVDFVLLTQMIAFRTSGEIGAALMYARRLGDRMDTVRVEARDRLDGPRWYFHHQIGSTMLAAGDSGGALLEFATGRQLGLLSAQPDAERAILSRIAMAHALRGSLDDAERALVRSRALPAPTPAQVTASISTERTVAALIAVERMADDQDDLLAELGPYDSLDLMWPFALLARTRSLLARQQPHDALEAIRLARDAHPEQSPESFASDIIAATTIAALVDAGDVAAARRNAEEQPGGGIHTRFARVRLSLREGRPDVAAKELRALAADPSLSPVQRAEYAILTGWSELARTDDLDAGHAAQVARVVRRPEYRRLGTILPRQLLIAVRERISAEAVAEFDEATAGTPRNEMVEHPVLTPGELRVLHALLDHESTAAIAGAFQVSPNTIKTQRRSLYRKLGCTNRDEALRAAARLHLLSAEETDDAGPSPARVAERRVDSG